MLQLYVKHSKPGSTEMI